MLVSHRGGHGGAGHHALLAVRGTPKPLLATTRGTAVHDPVSALPNAVVTEPARPWLDIGAGPVVDRGKGATLRAAVQLPVSPWPRARRPA
jgi:hypothetical protein